MSKLQSIKNYLGNADIAIYDDKNLDIRVDESGVKFLDEFSKDEVFFCFTNNQLEQSKFDGTDLVIDGNYFECKKINDCPVPVELMAEEDLNDLFEDIADDCEGSVRYGYSGRFMYNRRCYGVVTKDVSACLKSAMEKGLTGERQDSMGLDAIVYWPNVECKQKEEVDTE